MKSEWYKIENKSPTKTVWLYSAQSLQNIMLKYNKYSVKIYLLIYNI